MKNISVIGSGTMGNGIAQTFALFNHKVVLYDINLESLKKANTTILNNLERMLKKGIVSDSEMKRTVENIHSTTDFESVINSDLVIEAVSEDFDIKKSIFKKLDEKCTEKTILASNTSSISITKLANSTKRKGKVIGMHFMNPVPIMKLVEVIKTLHTSIDTVKVITSLAKIMGKTPVECNDYPGFISNRILMPMINEAIFCLEQNVAKKEAIDDIMKLGMSHPMGPLQLADFIGLDICLDIMEVLWSGFNDSKYRPCTLLKTMVSSGLLGKKTGRGFYKYD